MDILESLPAVKSDFIDFVFDKLIIRGFNINNIQLGIDILSEIKPRYEDYSSLFDDVFVRADSEANENIKTEILSGLQKLKPHKLNKINRDFWQRLLKI